MVNSKNDSFMGDLITALFGTEEDFNMFMEDLQKSLEAAKKAKESKEEVIKDDDEVMCKDKINFDDAAHVCSAYNPKNKTSAIDIPCDLSNPEYKVLSDKRICAISKEGIKKILELWAETEKLVFKLTSEFGINIWESQDDTIYNKFNLMIKQLLEMMFTSEEVDILEDWTFGYQGIEDNRPDFDKIWKNIIDE